MSVQNRAGDEGGLRTADERESAERLAALFDASPDGTRVKLAHFAKYIRRQDLTGLLAKYEIFKKILRVKGSVIECGVFRGGGLMSWANFSAVLEPNNITRRIYGFDSFEGFPEISDNDASTVRKTEPGELHAGCSGELEEIIACFDKNRFLGHVSKVRLIKGNAVETIPRFVEANPHLVVSLLFLDFDLYDPTLSALKTFVPRMPRGAVLAFDELDNPAWPGEALAALDGVGLRSLKLERLDFDPYIGFAVLD